MLVLSRVKDEVVFFGLLVGSIFVKIGEVVVVDIRGDKVRLGFISAVRAILFHRCDFLQKALGRALTPEEPGSATDAAKLMKRPKITGSRNLTLVEVEFFRAVLAGDDGNRLEEVVRAMSDEVYGFFRTFLDKALLVKRK